MNNNFLVVIPAAYQSGRVRGVPEEQAATAQTAAVETPLQGDRAQASAQPES